MLEHRSTSSDGHGLSPAEDLGATEPAAAPPRTSALTADGEVVPGAEIAAAKELARLPSRLGLGGRGVNGFVLYRSYRMLRAVWWATRGRGCGPVRDPRSRGAYGIRIRIWTR